MREFATDRSRVLASGCALLVIKDRLLTEYPLQDTTFFGSLFSRVINRCFRKLAGAFADIASFHGPFPHMRIRAASDEASAIAFFAESHRAIGFSFVK